jgi:predicted DNA-binding transcriptional regulator YafY
MAAKKTVRWINLVKVLRGTIGGLTTREILNRLEELPDVVPVDIRTVQRDLIELDESGIVALQKVIQDNRELWRLDSAFAGFSGSRFLTGTTALTLKMVIDHAQVLLPISAQHELRAQAERVDRALRNEGASGVTPWSKKVRVLPAGHQLAVPTIDERLVEEVYRSLALETKLRARYLKPGSTEATERDYSPLALVYRAPRLQLIVSTDSTRLPYVLAMHRIQAARALDSPIERPADFDLDQYIADGRLDIRVGDPIRLRLRCTQELADHWRTAALGTDQVFSVESGQPVLEVDCQHTKALRAYLLGLGAQVEVLGPEELRQWMGDEVTRIGANYTVSSVDSGSGSSA